jgi:hypothetical protein
LDALRKHYSGKGDTSRRIAATERISYTLHCKNERVMSFSTFHDKMQKMFNIFEEENESISEQAKVRMLLKKGEHPHTLDGVHALRVRASMSGSTFTECANHLLAQVSVLPKTQSNRKIAAAGSDRSKDPKRIRGGGPKDNAKRKGLYMPDGSVWTGYYSDWAKKQERKTKEERSSNGNSYPMLEQRLTISSKS